MLFPLFCSTPRVNQEGCSLKAASRLPFISWILTALSQWEAAVSEDRKQGEAGVFLLHPLPLVVSLPADEFPP